MFDHEREARAARTWAEVRRDANDKLRWLGPDEREDATLWKSPVQQAQQLGRTTPRWTRVAAPLIDGTSYILPNPAIFAGVDQRNDPSSSSEAPRPRGTSMTECRTTGRRNP